MGAQLGPENASLPGEQLRHLLDAKLLPAANRRVAGAVNQCRDRMARLRVSCPRQHHPGQDFQTSAVRLDLHAGPQFVEHARTAHVVTEIDVRPPRCRDRQPLASIARKGFPRDSLVHKQAKTGVSAGGLPTGLRPLKALVPGARSAQRRTAKGQSSPQRDASSQG